MKAYKGFNHDLTCRGFQYEIGKDYEENRAELCESGFHACEMPLDVFRYYGPVDDNAQLNRFCVVELDDVVDGERDDSKICGRKIHVEEEIGLSGLADAQIRYIAERADKSNANCNSGDQSVASNSGNQSVASTSGYYSVASNSGDRSVASNSGNRSVASNSGNRSVASNSGDDSVASNSGYMSVASNSGDRSVASNSGNRSVASNSGDYSVASNSGDDSVAEVTGKNGVAVGWGRNNQCKGSLGCYLVLSEWGEWDGEEYHLLNAKIVKVDGESIKADTHYALENGEIIEIQ